VPRGELDLQDLAENADGSAAAPARGSGKG
jgi:hypothetical protein